VQASVTATSNGQHVFLRLPCGVVNVNEYFVIKNSKRQKSMTFYEISVTKTKVKIVQNKSISKCFLIGRYLCDNRCGTHALKTCV